VVETIDDESVLALAAAGRGDDLDSTIPMVEIAASELPGAYGRRLAKRCAEITSILHSWQEREEPNRL
jgi:hypothetical protein